jgi:octaprenyl-diphosphate synthase
VDRKDRRWIVNVVKNRNEDGKAVARVMEMVTEAGGITHASEQMLSYRDQALAVLHTFPQNESRDALEGLVQMTVERTK